MNSVINARAQANDSESVSAIEAVQLIQVAGALELKRMEAKELREQFIALLPIATVEQFSEIVAAATNETEVPEGSRVNTDCKLSDEQEVELKKAREARAAHLTANKAQYVRPLLEDADQKLVSLKVRIGTKKTTTTARFERAVVGVKSKGLMAKCHALAAELKA